MRNYSFSVTKTYNVVLTKSASKTFVKQVHKEVYNILMELFENEVDYPQSLLTVSELRVWRSLIRFITSERKGRCNNTPFVYVNVNTGKSAAFYVNGNLTVDVIGAFREDPLTLGGFSLSCI